MKFKHRDDEFLESKIEKLVFIESKQYRDMKEGPVYGKYFEETGVYNIFPGALFGTEFYLGEILCRDAQIPNKGFCGKITDMGVEFYSDGEKIKIEQHSLYMDIFSRNSGILETKMMEKKGAVILGCGSVGSLVAIELAKSGIGNLFLIDPDMLEYHNLCRHQCGLDDVGDLKVNALKRKLLRINPQLNIKTSATVVENAPQKELEKFCSINTDNIFIGCADNRIADVYGNQIAIYFKASFISIGFWERAYAGEIFYHIPGENMPCYYCALGDGGGISERAIANHHVYSMEEDLEMVKFEPGISVDINFITTIGIKIALDLLNKNDEDYIPRLLNNLEQYTLICNTSNPQIGGEMVEIFSYPLQVTTSLVVEFNSCCKGMCRYEKSQMKEGKKCN